MLDRPTTGWPVFLHWARKFFEMPDFDQEERDYKLEAVRALRVARERLLLDSNWVEDLGRGFKNQFNNLVSHWQFVPFLDWVNDDRPAAADALRCLWTQDDLDATARLDAFSQRFPEHVLAGPGVRCNLAVYLLGAIDPIVWPNYKVSVITRAYELARYPRPEPTLSIGGVYSHALAFLDRLRTEAAATNLLLRDRLDAQGVMWCVVHWSDRPKNFSADEWQELLEFRAIRADRPKATKRPLRPAPRRLVCPLCALDEEVALVGPTNDGWLYICETGPGHEEPWEFSTRF